MHALKTLVLVWVVGGCCSLVSGKASKKHSDLSFGRANLASTTSHGDSDAARCKRLFCGAGRQCSVLPDGTATCVCVETCPDHDRQVCGTDGKTYQNHCFLHRAACTHAKHISIHSDGACIKEAIKTATAPPQPLPVVCLQEERDHLRHLAIEWFQKLSQAYSPRRRPLKPRGKRMPKAYRHTLRHQFSECDVDRSGHLDADEFVKCIGRNKTLANTSPRPGTSPEIMRGLCSDALIDVADRNKDWQLSLKEFRHLMNPRFLPPTKKCSLEDKHYEDGAETTVNCNKCVCACGHWVCTATACDEKATVRADGRVLNHHHDKDVKKVDKIEKEVLDEKELRKMLQKFEASVKADEKRMKQESAASESDIAMQNDEPKKQRGRVRTHSKRKPHHHKKGGHHKAHHHKKHSSANL